MPESDSNNVDNSSQSDSISSNPGSGNAISTIIVQAPDPGSDYINAHGEEHSRLAGLILDAISHIKTLLIGLVFIVFVSMAIITTNTVLTHRTQQDQKLLARGTTQFLTNYSNYMHCLVIVDEPLYAAIGKDAYFAQCDALLYKGTGLTPPVRPPAPTTTTITSTEDK